MFIFFPIKIDVWINLHGLQIYYYVFILNIDIMLIFIDTYQIHYNLVNLQSEFKTRQHIFYTFKKKTIFFK